MLRHRIIASSFAIILVSINLATCSGKDDITTRFSKDFGEISSVLKYRLESATENYRILLLKCKQEAITDVNPEEVLRINKAYSGEYINSFELALCTEARGKYDHSLVALARKLEDELTDLMRELLKKNKVGESIRIKKIRDYISYNADAISKNLKQQTRILRTDSDKTQCQRFRIYADKDWQYTGVDLFQDNLIEVYAYGKWAPGSNPKRIGDADTYHFELRVGNEGKTFCGGSRWGFKPVSSGKLFARIKGTDSSNFFLGKGSICVRLKWKETSESEPEKKKIPIEPLEYILARYTSDGGMKLLGRDCRTGIVDVKEDKKTSAQAATNNGENETQEQSTSVRKKRYGLKIYAAKSWQIYPIEIQTGDTVNISASGMWTPNQDQVDAGDANLYPYSIQIGAQKCGTGGVNCEFNATASGKLMLRIAEGSCAQAFGELDLVVTISRGK